MLRTFERENMLLSFRIEKPYLFDAESKGYKIRNEKRLSTSAYLWALVSVFVCKDCETLSIMFTPPSISSLFVALYFVSLCTTE
jgi:hypothetical protein